MICHIFKKENKNMMSLSDVIIPSIILSILSSVSVVVVVFFVGGNDRL